MADQQQAELALAGRFAELCATGSEEQVAEFIASDAHIHVGSDTGFYEACRAGRGAIVQRLLAVTGPGGVDVSHRGAEAFVCACENGHVDVLRAIVAAGRVPSSQALWAALTGAATCGHSSVLELLLPLLAAADGSGSNSMAAAVLKSAQNGHLAAVQTLLAAEWPGHGDTEVDHLGEALTVAAGKGHEGIVREILAVQDTRQAPASSIGTAVAAVCRAGHLGVLELLLTAAGDRSLQTGFLNACLNGHEDIVRHLAALFASEGAAAQQLVTQGLLQACLARRGEVVLALLLLQGDAAPAPDAYSNTLHQACMHGWEDVTELLLQRHSADGGSLTDRLSDAFGAASVCGRTNCMRMLLQTRNGHAIDVNASSGLAFASACDGGHLNALKLLLSLEGEQSVDITVQGGHPIFGAFLEGYTDVMRTLYSLPPCRRPSLRHMLGRASKAIVRPRRFITEWRPIHTWAAFMRVVDREGAASRPSLSPASEQCRWAIALHVLSETPPHTQTVQVAAKLLGSNPVPERVQRFARVLHLALLHAALPEADAAALRVQFLRLGRKGECQFRGLTQEGYAAWMQPMQQALQSAVWHGVQLRTPRECGLEGGDSGAGWGELGHNINRKGRKRMLLHRVASRIKARSHEVKA